MGHEVHSLHHAADPADLAIAAQLAAFAGDRLLEVRRTWTGDLRGLGRAGDAAAQDVLASGLASVRPGDAVLSEEAGDDPARLKADRVWIVDPLDGTREYSEGREDWAVHVALWERFAGDLTVGAVALPGRGIVLTSDGEPAPPRRDGGWRIAVSRTRPPESAQRAARELSATLVPMGSAGAKAAAVVLGEVDAYVHEGGQYQWDSAAPVAVARASGIFTSRLNGDPLRYNEPDPYLPDLIVVRPELAPQLLAAVQGVCDE
ncbi:MAG: 3'(2'),5'-bisphosphate nucleotidase CysQ [Sporichthyaceae bacterium]